MSQITMTPADAMITLEDVNKWYGQFHVLKDINLKVKQDRSAELYARTDLGTKDAEKGSRGVGNALSGACTYRRACQ